MPLTRRHSSNLHGFCAVGSHHSRRNTADGATRHCQLNCVSKTSPTPDARSRGRDGILSLAGRFGSEDPEGRARDEVALKVESVVDRGVHVQETLGGFGRFEALQLALSPSYHLVRILCPIVLSQPLFVTARQP